MAASGALEILATTSQIYHKKLLPTLNLNNPDANLTDLDLIQTNIREWIKPEKERRRIALKNSFGFGGVYVSLILAEFVK